MMKPLGAITESQSGVLPERKGCVSLAYDGGDISHFELVAPLLAQIGLTATFFLPSMELVQHASTWQAIHQQGFEMGSHSLFGFTDENGNLPNWTLEMVREDLRMSRKLLADMFPRQTDFPFAMPGHETGCVKASYDPSPTSYLDEVRDLFSCIRTDIAGFNSSINPDPSRLRSVNAGDCSPDEVEDFILTAIENREWLILRFGAVGVGEHAVDFRPHRQMLQKLAARSQFLEVAPMMECAQRLSAPGKLDFSEGQ